MDQLPRKLEMVDAAAIVVGIVIGSGIFLLPGSIARALPSGPAMLAVWVVAGLLSWCGALAYAELGAMIPATGGQYVFLREAYGPGLAFLCGWVFVLAVLPGGIAFLAVGFSIYLDHFVALPPAGRTAVALALVAALSAVNYIGVREAAWTQRVFTALKVGGLAMLIAAGFLAPPAARAAGVASPPLELGGFGFAMAACLMAYNGWSYVSFVAGEVKRPERSLPRALAISMATVMALYVLANVAYLRMMTIEEMAAADRVGAALALRALGPAGATVLSAVVLCSIAGAINGCILAAPRIPFAQARDGAFFHQFGRIHPRFETPSFAIVVLGLWTGVLILTGSFETLCSYTILSAWVLYTLTVVAVWVLRRKAPDAPRPCRMWGYPITLWLFVAVSAWYVLDSFISQPKPSLAALGIALSGVPFYFVWKRRKARAAAS